MLIFLLFLFLTAPLEAVNPYSQFTSVTVPTTYGNIIDMHQTADNDIIAAYYNSDTHKFKLVKIDPTGTIKETGGFTMAPEYDTIDAITWTDDFIVIIGSDSAGNLSSFLMRFNYTDLTIDTTFGIGAFVMAYTPNITGTVTYISKLIKSGSHYYLSGKLSNPNPPIRQLALLRYNLDGSPDTTFNQGSCLKTFTINQHETSLTENTNILVLPLSIIYKTTQRIITISRDMLAITNELLFDTHLSHDATLFPKNDTSFFTVIPVADREQDSYHLTLRAYDTDLNYITSVEESILTDSGAIGDSYTIQYTNNTFFYTELFGNEFVTNFDTWKIPFNNSLQNSTLLYHSNSTPTSFAFLATDETKPHYFLATDQTIRRIYQYRESISDRIRSIEYPIAFLS